MPTTADRPRSAAAPDAILLAWQAGQEGGHAIADVLSGKVNPSGKLATSFPAVYSDAPAAKNFPGTLVEPASGPANFMFGRPAKVTYEEGIYVGYRYYDTFGVKPAYPFGYGRSYTDFSYSRAKASKAKLGEKETATVTVEVTNTGKMAGREVVQLYVSAPGKTMDKPASELKGFAKTKLLAPGESETLAFTLSPADLASFDASASAWVAEPGAYTLKIGASSADVKQTLSVELPKALVVEKVHRVLAPSVAIETLKPKK
jgi:beta-glucosidase